MTQLPDETSPLHVADPAPTGAAEPTGGTGLIQSVDRAARILLAFAAPEQQLTVGELARMLGVHKSTASRLVGTLLAHGLLARGEGGHDELRLGPEIARLGRFASAGRDLVELSRAAMEELSADTGEGATLAIAEGQVAVTIAQSASTYVIGAQPWVGLRTPLHATSDGKVMLAFGAASLDDPAHLERVTETTIVDPTRMEVELDEIRQRGWGTSGGELELGLHGVAAPIFDATGACCAAVCISGPSYRITEAEIDRLGALVRRAADRISAAIAVEATRAHVVPVPTPSQVAQ
ncbi:MAG: IclR family transcriptional regulator [Solirubrobacteraceae bacterium]|nr:IclR family transcriptional regulator [Patulibacter sp.]